MRPDDLDRSELWYHILQACMDAAGPRKGTFPPFGFLRFHEPSFSLLCGRWAQIERRSYADQFRGAPPQPRVLPQASQSASQSGPIGRLHRTPTDLALLA